MVGLPVAALVVWALARLRRAAGVTSAWRGSLAEVGMVYGTVPFVWLTLMPGVAPGRVSLVPLRDLVPMGPIGIGGNLLVCAALGFFAPIRFAALASVPQVLAFGAGCSVLIETAQYVLWLDRVTCWSTPSAPGWPGSPHAASGVPREGCGRPAHARHERVGAAACRPWAAAVRVLTV
ncbi:VanZ family protein [Micromonospora sp. HM134]|uniref:VanZ family protein n=1 Tax=Micromonospora sp. HM134 TaxID=2583243 RepID=UPI001F0FE550|nr:VanZ family protein [Micromonospora sp. HM134]